MTVDEQLRAAGVRVTPIRQFVLEQLQRAERPVRVVDLLAARPAHLASSGSSALRRAMHALVSVGLVERLAGTRQGSFWLCQPRLAPP